MDALLVRKPPLSVKGSIKQPPTRRWMTADEARILYREPQVAFFIEHRGMRIFCASIGNLIFRNGAGFGIEFANVTSKVCGKPDVSVLVGSEAMRARIRCFERIFFNLSCFGIETP